MISSDDYNQQKFHDFNIIYDEKSHVCVDLDDTNNPQSSFSIRDYVFDSRNKDIARNWPFSKKTLQICLQNGVKNLLPPFQSLESLRNKSSNEEIISNQDLTLESRKTSSTNSGQTKSNKPVLVSSRKTKTTIKKFKIAPIEEIKPMASKVCPVCKTFSSSSNTTLNAHIDQCLCSESTIKLTTKTKTVVKHRIKPRKMRLMVDIYKTAPKCTIEELDARNGTSNWANNSSFPAQELEFQTEETTFVHENVVDQENDVYIDTNGTKVRILSVPKVDIIHDHVARKMLKGGRVSKSFIGKTEKNKDCEHKDQQLSPTSKKLCLSKPSEVTTGQEVTAGIGENCYKEDGEKNQTNHEMCMKMDDLPIVRPPWACSKRSRLAKKLQHSKRHNTTNNSSVANDKYISKCALKTPNSSSLNKPPISLQQNSQKIQSKQSKGSRVKMKFSVENTSGKLFSESMIHLETRKNYKETESQVVDLSDDIDIEKQQISYLVSEKLQQNTIQSNEEQQYNDTIDHDFMSDSPISTISNPALARSESDKFSVNENLATNYGDLRLMNSRVYKNDHHCCCSRKETVFSQTVDSNHHGSFILRPISPPAPVTENVAAPATVKLPVYNECDFIGSSNSKPVIRLMGKNLTVVNIDEDIPQISPNVQNPPNSLRNYESGTMFRNKFDDQMTNDTSMHKTDPHENVHNRTLYESQSSTVFSNGGFQAFSPFMEVGNNAKWNYTQTGSSSIYYASRFHEQL